jgi:TP901 family phage tail tape measure protein
VQPIVIKIIGEGDQAGRVLKQVQGAVQHTEGVVQRANGVLARFGGALAAAFSVGAIIRFTRQAISSADEIGKWSQRIGIATESLSALKFQAEAAGIGIGSFQTALDQLSRTVGGAARGQGEYVQTLQRLGVSAVDTQGRIRGLDDVMGDIADAFQAMPDGPAKAEAAMRLFGRAGTDMIPMLNEGRAGMAHWREEAEAAGVIVSQQTAKAAEEFNNNLTRLKNALSGVWMQIAEHLLPHLKSLTDWLLKSQRETGALSAVAETLADVFKVMVIAVYAVWTVLKSLATIIAANVVVSLEVMINSVGAIIQLFGLWWDTAKGLIDGLLTLGKTASGVSDVLSALWRRDFAAAKDAATEMVGGVSDALSNITTTITAGITGSAGIVAGTVKRTVEAAKGIAEGAFEDIAEQWQGVWDLSLKLFTPVKQAAAEVKEATHEMFAAVSDTGRKFLEDLEEQLIKLTATKRELLEREEATLMAHAERELAGTEQLAAAKQRIREIFAIRRLELARDVAARESAIEFARTKAERRSIETDPDLTRREQKQLLIPVIHREIEAIDALIASRRELAATTGDDAARLDAERELLELMQKRVDLERELQSFHRDNFLGGLSAGIKQLADEWENLGRRMADVMLNGVRRSIDTVADGIWDVVDGTRTWGQLFAQVARGIISDIIRIAMQQIASRALVGAKNILWDQKETLSKLPKAILESIGSWGLAAVVGVAAVVAAMAAFGGFAQGGIIREGSTPTADDVPIRVSKGEAVINARGVRNVGEDFINRLNAGLITDGPGQHITETLSSASSTAERFREFGSSLTERQSSVAQEALSQIISRTVATASTVTERNSEVVRDALSQIISRSVSEAMTLESRMAGALPSLPTMTDLGPVSSAPSVSSSGQRPLQIILVDDLRSAELLDLLESSAGEAKIVHIVKNNRTEIGLES